MIFKPFNVDEIKTIQQRESHDGAIGKARVLFSPLVSDKAAVRLLQRGDEARNFVLVHQIASIEENKELNGRESVEQMRIVANVASIAASFARGARHNKRQKLLSLLALWQRSQQIQRRHAPVHCIQLQMLARPVLERVCEQEKEKKKKKKKKKKKSSSYPFVSPIL
jgi:hypothetical protein